MNSSFTCISILVKSNIPKNCLIIFLNEVSSISWTFFLRLSNTYDDNSNKKKSDLMEMIIYGCRNGKYDSIDDISINKSRSILKENNINIKSLPGYGNLGLKKRDIKPYVENDKCSIKLKD